MLIYLYSSATSMNSLTMLGHQVDAELGAFSCAVTDVKKEHTDTERPKHQVRRRTHSHLGQSDLSIAMLPAEQHFGPLNFIDSQQSSESFRSIQPLLRSRQNI